MSSVNSHWVNAIFCIQTLSTCLSSTIGQYIYAFYLQIYPSPSNGTSNFTTVSSIASFSIVKATRENITQCVTSDVLSDNDAQAWAQQRSANLFFWTNLFNSCPLIVMTYILGLYTPKLGKRFVLILSILGIASQFAIWLSIMYLHLAEYWWYIAAVISGLSGSSGILTFVLSLIITENTEASDLSSRFVRLGALQTGLSSVVTLAIGYYINWRGYTDLFWIGLGLQLPSVLIVLIFFRSADSTVPERTPLLTPSTSQTSEEEFKELSSTCCGHFFHACTVFRSNRRGARQSSSLLLTLFANIFYILASSTFAPFLWFLLNAPFCWTSQDIGNYSALAAISYAVLSVIGMQALTNVGASDAMICLLSHVCFAASCVWLAFARHSWELYAGLVFSAFASYQGSLTISMMSKWLEPHERSGAFTLVTEINTIFYCFGSSLFNWVYARTVVNHRSFTLLLGASFSAVPLILNICLIVVTRKMSAEDHPPFSQTDLEPGPLRLPSQIPPHAGDASCLVIASRSLTTSLRTPTRDRSRANSISIAETDYITTTSSNDLIIL